jgi:hypothetical protein
MAARGRVRAAGRRARGHRRREVARIGLVGAVRRRSPLARRRARVRAAVDVHLRPPPARSPRRGRPAAAAFERPRHRVRGQRRLRDGADRRDGSRRGVHVPPVRPARCELVDRELGDGGRRHLLHVGARGPHRGRCDPERQPRRGDGRWSRGDDGRGADRARADRPPSRGFAPAARGRRQPWLRAGPAAPSPRSRQRRQHRPARPRPHVDDLDQPPSDRPGHDVGDAQLGLRRPVPVGRAAGGVGPAADRSAPDRVRGCGRCLVARVHARRHRDGRGRDRDHADAARHLRCERAACRDRLPSRQQLARARRRLGGVRQHAAAGRSGPSRHHRGSLS